jgi:polysaccharide pyruvyl transferase WcaK-like protein/2-polyprenyl-3-methyl-5-hydroxy-6-metoxy-1,4-benzoquinol methylase
MIADTAPRPLRLHIGHHFFGAGNMGDDLMLAGFLMAIEGLNRPVRFTCAMPFDPRPQEIRFPQIEWLPYDPAAREAAIRECDAWVGVGGTPFQTVVGPWMLEHLVAECDLCSRHGKPMYFVGIGVNEPQALADARARLILESASRIWARDKRSAQLLSEVAGESKVSAAADLGHVYLRNHAFAPMEDDAVGFVLHFEDSRQVDLNAVYELSVGLKPRPQRWLVQEIRPLAGSELAMLDQLAPQCRENFEVRIPAYADGSLKELLASWGSPGWLISSRYHAALIGAWAGSRVLAVERSDKIRGLVLQSEIAGTPDLLDARKTRLALDGAVAISRSQLELLADRAAASCREFISLVVSRDPGRVELADVAAKDSPRFHAFMAMMNGFAVTHGLREFVTWSKVWEYPWLWFAALSRIDWVGKHIVDLGSEVSPMPWLLATLGAKVTLIEADSQWLPQWELLRAKLRVDVSWHIVTSEAIPIPDETADVVTSFSVIEHQPDKEAAIREVVRVLKPGGVFAVSFDICQPDMGMTFPEWNGRALTLREFEDVLWLHGAFGNSSQPKWNLNAIEPFLAWHRTTAPHHNYVAAASVLVKRRPV